MTIAITAAELLTPLERIADPVLIIEDGRISVMGCRDSITLPPSATLHSLPEAVLAPAYFDLHIHGSAGYDVMEATDSGLLAMTRFLASHGVGSFLATTVTAPEDHLVHSIERIANQILHWNPTDAAARPIGIHLEGPCLSRVRRGVHPEQHLQNPSPRLLEKVLEAAQGTLKLVTVAPELPGALDLIREGVASGIRVAIGHTDATLDEALAAIEAGASHATHTFNAMRPLEHRSPGAIAAILTRPELTADIIADGVHVDPAVVDLFLRCKGRDRAVLITDAISAAGMPDGAYKLGEFDVEVKGDRCESGGRLAGSVLTLDRAVRNLCSFANWSLQDSVRLATCNPARVLGRTDVGTVRPGVSADIVVLTPEGHVLTAFVAGRKAN